MVGRFVGASAEICRPEFSRDVHSPADWLRAVTELAGSPEQRRAMGRRGRAFIENAHSLAGNAVRLAELMQIAVTTPVTSMPFSNRRSVR